MADENFDFVRRRLLDISRQLQKTSPLCMC